MITAITLTPDGTATRIELNPARGGADDIRRHLNADYFDHHTLTRHHPAFGHLVGWVHDSGLLIGLPINPVAMLITSSVLDLPTQVPIVGNVVFTGLDPAGETTSLTPAAEGFINMLTDAVHQTTGGFDELKAECDEVLAFYLDHINHDQEKNQ